MSIATLLVCLLTPTTMPTTSGNPVFVGADPHAMVVGHTVWVYPTFSPRGEEEFYAFDSDDLVHWQRHGPILRFRDVRWINDDGRTDHGAWAPGAVERGGKFYFYFAVGDQNVTPSRIGVAVSDSPSGPFKDSGKPLPCTGARNKFEAIDPMVFVDAKTDKAYLYAGGSNGATLRVFEMDPDMVSFAREVKVQTPPKFTEGAFMHERDGVYYLSYSHGGYRDATYSVHYATAPSPTGPWTYRGPILTTDATRKGPGHHSLIKSATGQWYIVYHRWDHREGDGPYHGEREVCIDKLDFNSDGTIKPVVMTDAGVAADTFGER